LILILFLIFGLEFALLINALNSWSGTFYLKVRSVVLNTLFDIKSVEKIGLMVHDHLTQIN